jgi:hypothetical protein
MEFGNKMEKLIKDTEDKFKLYLQTEIDSLLKKYKIVSKESFNTENLSEYIINQYAKSNPKVVQSKLKVRESIAKGEIKIKSGPSPNHIKSSTKKNGDMQHYCKHQFEKDTSKGEKDWYCNTRASKEHDGDWYCATHFKKFDKKKKETPKKETLEERQIKQSEDIPASMMDSDSESDYDM